MAKRGFFSRRRSKPKPVKWAERPKVARIRRKNVRPAPGYKKFWPNL